MYKTLLFLLMFASSVQAAFQAGPAPDSSRQAVREAVLTYLMAIESENFDKARQSFTRIDGKVQQASEQELRKFAAILQRFLKDPNLQAVQSTHGLYTLSYNGLSFSMIRDIEGEWHFTALTKRNINKLHEHMLRFATPDKTIQTFIKEMQRGNTKAARHCFALPAEKDQLVAFEESLSEDKLKIFLHVIQETTKKQTPGIQEGALVSYSLPYEQNIYLFRNTTGEWLFTPATRENIAVLFNSIERADADRLAPPALKKKFFLLENWQWIGITIILLTGFILQKFIRFILDISITKRLYRQEENNKSKKHSYYSITLLSHSACWYILIPYLKLSTDFRAIVEKFTLGTMMFGGLLTLGLILDIIRDIALAKAEKSDNKVDDVLVPMVHRTVKIILYLIGFIFIAGNVGVDVAGLIAGLGIGGLAFALAAKDTVENLFGSVTVLLDKPFEVGDWVVVDGVEGVVEQIGLRSTRVRTFYCSLVNVPNAKLISAVVDNYGRRSYRRIRTTLGVTYDTPPAKIEAFCEGIRELIRQHPYTRKDYYHVYLNQFSGSSLDILLYCFIDCNDWAIELRERQRLFMDILRLANRLGVGFAFPTQTLHMAKTEDLYAPETEISVEEIEKQYSDGRLQGSTVFRQSLGGDKADVPASVNYIQGNGFSS